MNFTYIHIPFCKQKCKYCSFVSYPKIGLIEEYLISLKKEILSKYKDETLKTLYIGGGTPSLLTPEQIRFILKLFNLSENTEITIELNPETITFDYLLELKNIGINRLSFGCQTFNDEILKYIGRRHNSQDVKNAVKYSKDAGFTNISLDFIYGLPNQTIEIFENDLKTAIQLDIKHISLYGLKIDEDCYFAKNPPENLPDDDIQADMYLKAIKILKENNFEHYEISNFSKEGFNSKHNLNYWDNNTYYGFGCSAHGYENGIRYANETNLEKYIQNPVTPKTSHALTKQEKLEEEIFLGFRKMSGINVKEINQKFNIDFYKKYEKILKKYISFKYLSETNSGFKFTNEGVLISNTILSEFLD